MLRLVNHGIKFPAYMYNIIIILNMYIIFNSTFVTVFSFCFNFVNVSYSSHIARYIYFSAS